MSTKTTRKEKKFLAVARALEDQITSGAHGPGAKLPSERALASTYSVTVMTVRHALSVLAEKGLITRQHGSGTFVSRATDGPVTDESKRDVPATGPIHLIGLGPTVTAEVYPVNWRVHLRRLQGMLDAALELEVQIQSHVDFDPSTDARDVIESFRGSAGLLLHSEVLPEAAILGLRSEGVPVVAINCYSNSNCCSRVHVDGRHGAALAVRHLVELHHQRIGLIVGDQKRHLMKERHQGYCDALAAAGIAYDEGLIAIDSRGLPRDGGEAALELLSRPNPPTAIFAVSDNRAVGALTALSTAGFDVPDSVSIVGFDKLEESASTNPPLTTVANPIFESGAEAVKLLVQQIRDHDTSIRVLGMTPSLVVRASSSGPRSAARTAALSPTVPS